MKPKRRKFISNPSRGATPTPKSGQNSPPTQHITRNQISMFYSQTRHLQ